LAVPSTVGWYRFPAWSPDGTRILFEADAFAGAPSYVMVANVDGTGLSRLATGGESGPPGAHPVWSPDGTEIAFARNDGLYVMRADGTGVHQVGPAGAVEPSWQSLPGGAPQPATPGPSATTSAGPAGGEISYTVEGPSDADIYVIRPDGTGRTRLTDERGWDQASAWSPDGTRIAFTSFRPNMEGNPPAIYLMNADGTGLQLVVANAFGSSWSPDGGRIAYSSQADRNVDIYVVGADGTGLSRLTDDPARDVSPTWSPDGMHIAFVEDSNGAGFGRLYVMDADGTHAQEVPTDNLVADPRWSPDGTRILFAAPRGRDPDGPTDIFVVNPDGTGLTALTDDPARDLSPTWSPDGSYIAFSSDRGGVRQIYVMNADGSTVTSVTGGAEPATFPAWGEGYAASGP